PPKLGMGGKHFLQGTRRARVNHGARVHGVQIHRSHAAITAGEKVEINGIRRRLFTEVRFQADPLPFAGDVILRQLRPSPCGVDYSLTGKKGFPDMHGERTILRDLPDSTPSLYAPAPPAGGAQQATIQTEAGS